MEAVIIVIHLMVIVALIAVVLLQRSEGGALSEGEVVEIPSGSSYRLQLENLADAIQERAPQRLGRDDAVGQARTIEALYRAADDGRTVAVADVA